MLELTLEIPEVPGRLTACKQKRRQMGDVTVVKSGTHPSPSDKRKWARPVQPRANTIGPECIASVSIINGPFIVHCHALGHAQRAHAWKCLLQLQA